MPEFYILAQKIFFPIFLGGGDKYPYAPVSCAYDVMDLKYLTLVKYY